VAQLGADGHAVAFPADPGGPVQSKSLGMTGLGLLVLCAGIVTGVAAIERPAGSAPAPSAAAPTGEAATIVVDYPLDDSIFPPDMAAPTFLWRDASPATSWQVDVVFADDGPPLRLKTLGPRLRVGEIDPRAVGPTNELPKLTPDQAAARTWKPDAARRRAADKPAGPAPITRTS